jgi:aryl-alcohol dehydrogenase-like predicted oxidoreductase
MARASWRWIFWSATVMTPIAMNYKIFGRRTGLRVSELALGTGNFGTGWGYGSEPADARKMFDRFAQAGGTFIDTADTYQFGQSERLVGEFIPRSV